jgi:hypothetical protein
MELVPKIVTLLWMNKSSRNAQKKKYRSPVMPIMSRNKSSPFILPITIFFAYQCFKNYFHRKQSDRIEQALKRWILVKLSQQKGPTEMLEEHTKPKKVND